MKLVIAPNMKTDEMILTIIKSEECSLNVFVPTSYATVSIMPIDTNNFEVIVEA